MMDLDKFWSSYTGKHLIKYMKKRPKAWQVHSKAKAHATVENKKQLKYTA
jgi:hypothetical protein